MIPAVVVGGYLGAGKTTLVNHLLRATEGVRIAVLVNDFGSVGIDQELIVGADGEVLSLAGGCVCCAFGSDLVGSLARMAAREPAPDVIVIESSGVGVPGEIARTVRLARGVEPAGVVGLVDGSRIADLARDRYVGDVVLRQLADADVLVLNRSDGRHADDVRASLRGLGATGRVVVDDGGIDPAVVLGLDIRGTGPATDAPSPPPPVAADRFRHWSRTLAERVDPAAAVAAEMRAHPDLVRLKGVVEDLAGRWMAVQVVGSRVEIMPAPAAHAGSSILVGIDVLVDEAEATAW